MPPAGARHWAATECCVCVICRWTPTSDGWIQARSQNVVALGGKALAMRVLKMVLYGQMCANITTGVCRGLLCFRTGRRREGGHGSLIPQVEAAAQASTWRRNPPLPPAHPLAASWHCPCVWHFSEKLREGWGIHVAASVFLGQRGCEGSTTLDIWGRNSGEPQDYSTQERAQGIFHGC